MLRPCVVLVSLALGFAACPAGGAEQPTRAGSSYPGPGVNPAAWPSPTHYVAPDGSDENDGTSPESAWLTFAHAVAQLRPGDVLGAVDGVYEPQTTGLIHVDCRAGAMEGTAEAPITVRAVNERRAILRSDGLVTAINAVNARYWNFLGLVAVGADKKAAQGNYHLIGVDYSHSISVKRCVVAYANRTGWNANNQLHSIRYSTDVTVEECEYYGHHRHALSLWKSHNCTARRNYVNPRHHRGPDARGDEAIVFYQSSWCIAENNISEGLNLGFQAHGGVTFDGLPGGGHNQFLGNISIGGWNATRTDSRLRPHTEIKPATGNIFRDFLVVRPQRFGIWLSSTTDTLVENATIYAGESDGFVADERGDGPYDEVPGGCSCTLRNSLIVGGAGAGVRTTYPQWLVESCLVTGNAGGDYLTEGAGEVRDSLDLEPTGIGLGAGECIVYVPAGSQLRGAGTGGADVGANVIYRYVDGELTPEPLWDPITGEFPHGPTVEGISDVAGDSLFDVHARLNVNCNGCALPYSR